MTDPERLSLRSTGLAAELLQAAVDEQPSERGMQQTLLALGVSGVILSSSGAAAAAGSVSAASTSVTVSSVGLASGGSVHAVSAMLIVKWVGLGVLGGFGLAGVAAVATLPPPRPTVTHAASVTPRVAHSATPLSASARAEPNLALAASSAPELAASATQPRAAAVEPRVPAPAADDSALLAAEVAYVDRARALLAAGLSEQGLSLLENYEQQFHEPRLLPEVLFLRLETYELAGQGRQARAAAQRLVSDFPTSPHAGHARKLLGE